MYYRNKDGTFGRTREFGAFVLLAAVGLIAALGVLVIGVVLH